MSKNTVSNSIMEIDKSISKGGSRVYQQSLYNDKKYKLIRENKQIVLDYIFNSGDPLEELNDLEEEFSTKLVKHIIADNGWYIYTINEIIEHGKPKGKYYVQVDDKLITNEEFNNV